VRPRHISAIVLVTAVAVVVATASCFAEPVDSHTSCSLAIRAFDSGKRAGQVLAGAPSPEVLEVGNYIMNVMEQLDRRHTDKGEPGIWSNLSDAERHSVVGSAVANCRFHPRRTIYTAAGFVYREVRYIQIQLGVAK
jgi:hypothetical protein